MLATYLTREWSLQTPIIGAPMTPMSGGRLAAALSRAGALGMIGVSSTQAVQQLERDEDARSALQKARESEDYSRANLYAGQSVGLLDRVEPAAAIVARITAEAEACLRAARSISS